MPVDSGEVRARAGLVVIAVVGSLLTALALMLGIAARSVANERMLDELAHELESVTRRQLDGGRDSFERIRGAVAAAGDPVAAFDAMVADGGAEVSAAVLVRGPTAGGGSTSEPAGAREGDRVRFGGSVDAAGRTLLIDAAEELFDDGRPRARFVAGDGQASGLIVRTATVATPAGTWAIALATRTDLTPVIRSAELDELWIAWYVDGADGVAEMRGATFDPVPLHRSAPVRVDPSLADNVTIAVGARRPLATGTVQLLPGIALVAGTLATLVVALLFLAVERQRRRAHLLEVEKARLDLAIAEHPRTVAELEANAEIYRRILANSPDVLLLFDLRNRSVTFLNRRGFLDYPFDTSSSGAVLAEAGLLEILSPEDRPRLLAALDELGRTDTDRLIEVELRIRSAAGEWEWARLRLARLDTEVEGPADHLVGVVGLVTDQHRERARREELERQLRQAQRLEAVGQLAGGVAHDLNNVLAAVLSLAELAALEIGEGTAHDDLLEIRRTAKKGADLLRQLLIFSRRDRSQPEALDLNEVITSMENLLSRTLSRMVRLQLRLAPNLPPIVADMAELEQAITNLAVNARDAMSGRGMLSIETATVYLEPGHIALGADGVPGPYVRLSVTDTGAGMTAEVRNRIFEPFFTTKGIGQGTGLGLAMVYGMVTGVGGRLEVWSEPGRGTVFKLYFPLAVRRPAARSETELPGIASMGRGERILLVDDEAALRDANARILGAAGYDVVSAGTAREALDADVERCAAALLDIVMPDLDGITLAARLRERRPGLPVVFASGFAAEDLAAHARRDAAAVVLQKPFTSAALVDAVQDALSIPAHRSLPSAVLARGEPPAEAARAAAPPHRSAGLFQEGPCARPGEPRTDA